MLTDTMTEDERLNPFFIRSAVGIPTPRGTDMNNFVLIPSSSGLRLESIRSLANGSRETS